MPRRVARKVKNQRIHASKDSYASGDAEQVEDIHKHDGGSDGGRSYESIDLFRDPMPNEPDARKTAMNFYAMSVLFGVNHGCVMTYLSLSTAKLGSLGAWQNAIFYLIYSISAITGSTSIVHMLGVHLALLIGMAMHCVFVGCFWIATSSSTFYFQSEISIPADTMVQQNKANPWDNTGAVIFALSGAIVGGLGTELTRTAYSFYFDKCTEEHARFMEQPIHHSTALFADVFGNIYFSVDIALRTLLTVLLGVSSFSWNRVLQIYTAIALFCTGAIIFTNEYTDLDYYDRVPSREPAPSSLGLSPSSLSSSTGIRRPTAQQNNIKNAYLLFFAPQMKYMVGLNMVFGFSSAFLNSYVNGEVVQVSLHDDASRYVGILTAWISIVNAIMTVIFRKLFKHTGRAPLLVVGVVCCGITVLTFFILPNSKKWGWVLVLLVYTFHGVGRAAFECNLKAMFADFFQDEEEAFDKNIVLQNGLYSIIGSVLPYSLYCSTESTYCLRYRNGTLNHVLTFHLVFAVSAIFAIFGLWRAVLIQRIQQDNKCYAIPV